RGWTDRDWAAAADERSYRGGGAASPGVRRQRGKGNRAAGSILGRTADKRGRRALSDRAGQTARQTAPGDRSSGRHAIVAGVSRLSGWSGTRRLNARDSGSERGSSDRRAGQREDRRRGKLRRPRRRGDRRRNVLRPAGRGRRGSGSDPAP